MEPSTSEIVDTPAPHPTVSVNEPLACLYHERQVASLCGVHTINTLLQGPFVNEVDLATIAHDLDALERQFMAESGLDSEEYQRFLTEESSNVAADGMFSIQVLSKALEVWGLSAIPLNNPAVRGVAREPDAELAFICNCNEHWFTVRKVNDEWWNFNSLLPAPAPLSAFYLAAFLTTLQEQGYTLFVVRGTIPVNLLSLPDLPQQGRYYTPEQARSITKSAAEARTTGYRHALLANGGGSKTTSDDNNTNNSNDNNGSGVFTGTGRTLRDRSRSPGMMVNGQHEDEDLQRAIAASLQQPPQQVGGDGTADAGPSTAGGVLVQDSNDSIMGKASTDVEIVKTTPPTAQAAASVPTEQPAAVPSLGDAAPQLPAVAEHAAGPSTSPAGPSTSPAGPSTSADTSSIPTKANIPSMGMLQIAIRMPAGDRIVRKFKYTATVGDVYYMLTAACKDRTKYELLRQYPRAVLPDDDTTKLVDAGVLDKETLTFERKPELPSAV